MLSNTVESLTMLMHVKRPPLLHSLEDRKLEFKSQCLKVHGPSSVFTQFTKH